MVQTTNETKHKRSIIYGALLLTLSVICIVMTIIFTYVSNRANEQIEGIREDYRAVAERRDQKVAQLAGQVTDLQKKLDVLPDRTADKTANKVKEVVKEDEAK
ncbi:hypothetical protein [Pantoea sp.]|uniref:hypothetical protein n=1 Tax=Pantoea sp. TaxID=69393 RepID=UPI0028A283FE|nr:hypothetical protein [Pantoea sp.]